MGKTIVVSASSEAVSKRRKKLSKLRIYKNIYCFVKFACSDAVFKVMRKQ